MFEGEFECFGENKEKYKNFSVAVKKEIIKADKEGNEIVKTKFYKTKFIDSARFMASSNLIVNLTEGIHKIKCKDCGCFFEYESVKDNLIKYQCLSYNKNYSNKLDEELKNKFKNTFKFSNNAINKFILLLRKGVYPYENIDDWEKFNETTLPEKEEFYNNLNIEDITNVDCMHGKRVFKYFKIKNLGEYDDLYLRSDTLPLADVFENFRVMSLKIYQLDPAKFFSAPGLAWQAALKKDKSKSRSFN